MYVKLEDGNESILRVWIDVCLEGEKLMDKFPILCYLTIIKQCTVAECHTGCGWQFNFSII